MLKLLECSQVVPDLQITSGNKNVIFSQSYKCWSEK